MNAKNQHVPESTPAPTPSTKRAQGPIRLSRTNQFDEISTRTEQGRMLLRPSDRANELILGCIGRAQERHDVRIHAFVFMSNHYHMLTSADDAKQLSSFIGYVNGNITRELNRLTGWHGPMWRRRFRAIPVNCDDVTQRARLRYLLAHGIKEGLVDCARDWPGATSLPWMLDGQKVTGVWVDRTAMALDRKRGIVRDESSYERVIPLKFTPMPCFAGMADDDWRAEVAAIVAEIEAEYACIREEAERLLPGAGAVMGAAKVRAQDPMRVVGPPSKRRTPIVHASDSMVRTIWLAWTREMRRWYQEAATAFREGDCSVVFPPGVFRPQGPFEPLPDRDCDYFVGPREVGRSLNSASQRPLLGVGMT